ncbi:hypothetical protein [Anaeromyxobacter oryzae]|uniref:Zinc-finger domain-containing protein n=1 Tax=Anaeromyxobacter oryzae TaxID=2918170 RepID=A0ABM7WSQ5_9BACT|nr:hypothetical protein [Anaeromyxobacter oryzae]BDG02507.1 hypothetical protein AMOR_15030 [Anaeromyxobacter oryzae]
MAGCESFEIAIEMARHGALGEPERTALGRHLSGCASCRAFEESSRRAEGVMSELTGEALRQVDWDRVERGIRRRMAENVVRMAVGAVVCVAVMGVLVLLDPEGQRLASASAVAPAIAGIFLAVMGLVGWNAWRTARLPTRGEVLAYQRRITARSLAILSRTRWLVLAVAALEAVRALEGPDLPHTVIRLYVAVILAAIFGYATWFRLPRLRRELADLGPAER